MISSMFYTESNGNAIKFSRHKSIKSIIHFMYNNNLCRVTKTLPLFQSNRFNLKPIIEGTVLARVWNRHFNISINHIIHQIYRSKAPYSFYYFEWCYHSDWWCFLLLMLNRYGVEMYYLIRFTEAFQIYALKMHTFNILKIDTKLNHATEHTHSHTLSEF